MIFDLGFDVINLIMEYVIGKTKNNKMINLYQGSNYCTVPDYIRKTQLRRFLLPHNIPDDYLICSYGCLHDLFGNDIYGMKKIKKLKLLSESSDNYTFTLNVFPDIREILLPKSNKLASLHFYETGNYNTLIKIAECDIRITNKMRSYSSKLNVFIKCTNNCLTISSNLVNQITSLSKSINTLEIMHNDDYAIYELLLDSDIFDNITTIYSTIHHQVRWVYPKNCKYHKIKLWNNTDISILDVENISQPAIFFITEEYNRLSVTTKHIDRLHPARNITHLALYNITGYRSCNNPVDRHKIINLFNKRFNNIKTVTGRDYMKVLPNRINFIKVDDLD